VSDHIAWNIFGNDTSCADYHIVPDGDARHNNSSSANPYIVPNDNRGSSGFAEFKGTIWLRLPKAFSGICGVEGSVNLDIWCNQGIIADHDFVVIQKGAVHV